jgi:hypothetical protein
MKPVDDMVTPAEAIAIALSMVPKCGGKIMSPDSAAVRLVLKAIKEAGWKLEPR